MRILCTGLNHKTAEVSLREKVMFNASQMQRGLEDLSRRWPGAEFTVLSTCNRTEIYTARAVHGHPRVEELRQWLERFHSFSLHPYDGAVYMLADADAARHLLEVAAGLDSLVLGEDQIVGQIKEAYAAAVRCGCVRAVMNDLFQQAFHVAKHVRSETAIAEGKVSVASVAIDLVKQTLGTLADKCFLSVGAGKMNKLMLRHVAALGPRRLVVANRSAKAARVLAAEFGGQAVSLRDLPRQLIEADAVVTSTASKTPIITRAMVEAAQEQRLWRPLLIVDIAVPRDVEPLAGNIRNVTLRNIDELESVVQSTLATRGGQRDAAQKIIERHVREIARHIHVRYVAPTIEALYRRMKKIADEELAQARNKLSTHADGEEDMAVLQRALHRTIRRILHPAARNLRRQAGADGQRAHVAAIRKLFELEE